ncbi:DUF3112 domain-containing protein [Kocuria palustris]|nr:DUF3112 domain-containing protein [Kocuria palustris]
MSDKYPDPPSPAAGIIHLITNLRPGPPDRGTGIVNHIGLAYGLLGDTVPPTLVEFAVGIQNNLFGNYPTKKDVAPSILFAVIFGLIFFVHLGIFIVNCLRGHYFWISLAWIFYSMLKTCGWALRAQWGQNVVKLNGGLALEFLLIIGFLIIASFNLMLAQRLFTWRHPVGGSRKLFWFFMIGTYFVVIIILVVALVASFVPYLHFLLTSTYEAYQWVVKVTGIFMVLYPLLTVALLILLYWAPTSNDELLYTYQPWWIESFAPTYFVRKGAAQEAEETFMKRNSSHRHAIRVIAATHHHYHCVEGLTNQRGTLKHNILMGLLCISTILLMISAIGRCVVVWQARLSRDASPAALITFMYFCWGVFEVIINVLYIVGRVDLRFYRPDVLPAKVRAIITAEQSVYNSDDEESDHEVDGPDYPRQGGYYAREKSPVHGDYYDEEKGHGGYYGDGSDIDLYTSEDSRLDFQDHGKHDPFDTRFDSDLARSLGSGSLTLRSHLDISVMDDKLYLSRSPLPPYPADRKRHRDDESEFNF